jgi:phage terminase large subunit
MKGETQTKELVINPIFEPIFSDNLDDPRYIQCFGGRGSGKSFSVSVAAVTKTYSKYKHKILYLRQVMATADDSVIADVIEAIRLMGKTSDFRIKKNLITNIRTGSTISFKGIRTTGGQTAKLKS